MKFIYLIIVFVISVSSLSAMAQAPYNLFCRKSDDVRQIIYIKNNESQWLVSALDEYEDHQYDTARRSVELSYGAGVAYYQARGVLFESVQGQITTFPQTHVDGNRNVLFDGYLYKGLRKSYQGKYVCISCGYLALTIKGDEPDGGYSVSINQFSCN